MHFLPGFNFSRAPLWNAILLRPSLKKATAQMQFDLRGQCIGPQQMPTAAKFYRQCDLFAPSIRFLGKALLSMTGKRAPAKNHTIDPEADHDV
jgi:hypothetical protein